MLALCLCLRSDVLPRVALLFMNLILGLIYGLLYYKKVGSSSSSSKENTTMYIKYCLYVNAPRMLSDVDRSSCRFMPRAMSWSIK